MTKIIDFDISDKENYLQALAIREQVFIDEQQVERSLEVENEVAAHYYLLLLDEVPLATGRWRKTSRGIKLERFAVLPQYRNQNYGSILLQHILKQLDSRPEELYLHAQLKAIPYYERQGFRKEGDMFTEANILHYLMTKPK
ncbi:MAG: GNAT family N-acetyltransferase [Bacteroidales bacterium]|jgi:predicted GNAT family N-acyltransferase|nr:GNAT family N-acetyltransferase [Bacteroidales bacterium]